MALATSLRWHSNGEQWRTTLVTYADPVIGRLLVRDVQQAHILKILEPIWTTKTETASRLRGRIENVLDYASARGYRSGDNPARWSRHLDKVLATPSKAAKVEHHSALDSANIGAFMVELRRQFSMVARALKFAIITAARPGEVRGASWAEVDLDKAVWTIPEQRMGAGREHRIPLSVCAVNLLCALPRMVFVRHFATGRGRPRTTRARSSSMPWRTSSRTRPRPPMHALTSCRSGFFSNLLVYGPDGGALGAVRLNPAAPWCVATRRSVRTHPAATGRACDCRACACPRRSVSRKWGRAPRRCRTCRQCHGSRSHRWHVPAVAGILAPGHARAQCQCEVQPPRVLGALCARGVWRAVNAREFCPDLVSRS